MSELTSKRCKPCEGGVDPLTLEQSQDLLKGLTDWQLTTDGKQISHDFKFNNYYETMAFVNGVAWMTHLEDHHPDMEVGYNHCLITYTTHAINGLSENDFICAAKVDALLAPAETVSPTCEI